jgi:hypothetical protein
MSKFEESFQKAMTAARKTEELLRSSEPIFAKSYARSKRLEHESEKQGKTFGSPYRLSVYADSVWRGVEPTGDTGHFGFYDTEDAAERAANLYKQKHATPPMMSLSKRVSAKRDLPVWDEFNGLRRVGAEVAARIGKPQRPKSVPFPPGTETLTIQREPLDQQGYARGGRYFGTGEKLWSVDDGEHSWHVRAPSRADARRVALDPKWGR